MVYTYRHRDITWIDLENPTQEEVRGIIETYEIDPLVANELLTPTVRPHVDLYENFIYLILHFPAHHTHTDKSHKTNIQEVDFIIGQDFIITTRYDNVDALHEFSKIFEVNSILDKSNMGEHAGFIFFYMMQHFYKIMVSRIDNVRALLADTEEQIFNGNEKNMVMELSRLNRLLLTYKESLILHKAMLESFEVAGRQFFPETFRYYLRGIIGEYFKVHNAMGSTKDYLNELRNTNDSLLTTKQNEIMKTLTILSFVVFPLSLIAGIFGMNSENMPLIGSPNDFSFIILLMLSLTVTMFIFFRNRKWL